MIRPTTPIRQQWQYVGDEATEQREFRGINKLDAFSISPSFATDMKNLTSSGYPALTTRTGYTVLGSAIGTKVLGLGVWKGTELHAVFNDGTWRKWDGSAWVTIKSGLSTTAECYFTNFQGAFPGINLIMANGVDPVQRYDGATAQNLSNTPSGAKYITTFRNRLWAVIAEGKEIRASALDNAEDWTPGVLDDSKAYGKEIESPSGETINGLFGELAKMTISFPSSIRKLQGGVPSDFNDQSVSQTLGIANNRSAVTLDGMMYLINSSGLYSYGGGIAPDKSFSEVVQYYVDNANASGRDQSAVGTDGRNLYFSIPVGNSTPDTIIEYDNTHRVWNVWKDVQALHFVRMGNDLYIGDARGRVLKLGGTSDAGTPISWHWVSKPFTAQSMSQVIRWLRMWVTASLPTGSTMNVYLSKSATGEDWESVGSITASSNLQRRAIYVQSSKVSNAREIRFKIAGTGPATIHEVAWEQDQLPLR